MKTKKLIKTDEYKQAERIAYEFLYSPYRMHCGKTFKADKRTRVGKLAYVIFKKIKDTYCYDSLYQIRKIRINQKPEIFKNILKNKLYLDYKRNGNCLILEDRIRFENRNHWCKNSEDIRVLQILKKHQKKYTK